MPPGMRCAGGRQGLAIIIMIIIIVIIIFINIIKNEAEHGKVAHPCSFLFFLSKESKSIWGSPANTPTSQTPLQLG